MKRRSRLPGALGLVLIASTARSAFGADAPPAPAPEKPAAPDAAKAEKSERARALFKEGRELAQKGDWDGACPKFQASLDLEPGLGTQYNLADCLAHRGRTASARSLFLEVAERARAAAQGDRERVARARAAELEGRVPSLVIEVAYPAREQEVRRDGTPLPAAAWGSALPIDPGASVISATAPGKQSWSTRVDVPGTGVVVTVLVPRLEDKKAEAAPVAVVVPPEAKSESPKPAKEAPPEVPPEPEKKSNVLPIVLLATAGAGAILGVTSMVLYKRSNDDAEGVCPSSVGCSQAQVSRHDDLVDDAKGMRTVGFVGFGVAGAALVTAGILVFTGRHRENPVPPPVTASAFVGRDGFSAGLNGRF